MSSVDVNGVNGTAHTNGIKSKTLPARPHPRVQSYAAKFNLPDHFIGGNKLEAAPPGAVKDFVAENDGHTVITNVSCPVQAGEKL